MSGMRPKYRPVIRTSQRQEFIRRPKSTLHRSVEDIPDIGQHRPRDLGKLCYYSAFLL